MEAPNARWGSQSTTYRHSVQTPVSPAQGTHKLYGKLVHIFRLFNCFDSCPQWDGDRRRVIGSQDCLYLSVFTPYVPSTYLKWTNFVIVKSRLRTNLSYWQVPSSVRPTDCQKIPHPGQLRIGICFLSWYLFTEGNFLLDLFSCMDRIGLWRRMSYWWPWLIVWVYWASCLMGKNLCLVRNINCEKSK